MGVLFEAELLGQSGHETGDGVDGDLDLCGVDTHQSGEHRKTACPVPRGNIFREHPIYMGQEV